MAQGIKETIEALEAVKILGEKLEAGYADDGKLDFSEILDLALAEVRPGWAALDGCEKIPAEWSDLDAQEIAVLGPAVFTALSAFLRMMKVKMLPLPVVENVDEVQPDGSVG